MTLARLLCSFNETATTEIYTLSLHDALPILRREAVEVASARRGGGQGKRQNGKGSHGRPPGRRSEEHTSELQSHHDLVCRLLLEKKKGRDDAPPSRRSHTTKGRAAPATDEAR